MKALAGIHRKGIIHRDLKLQNILVDFSASSRIPLLFISDFGFAIRKNDIFNNLRCGTPGYVAPEIFFRNAIYSEKSDIFSLGALLFKLCTGRSLI